MYYETVFVINPDISQENVHEFTDQLVEKVEKASGRIVKREYWGSLPLAYPINKRKRGHYLLLVTDGEPEAVAVLENALTLDERTMRYQTIRLSELTDTPSPLARRERSSEDATDEEASEADTVEATKPEGTEAAPEPEAPSEKESSTEESSTEEATTEEAPAKESSAKTEAKEKV